MHILRNYIFRSVLGTAVFSIGLFVAVFMAGVAIREVIEPLAAGQLSWAAFFKILSYHTPSILVYVLPIGLLTSVLIVLGRLSANHEITAMKASGISLHSISAPILAIALSAVALSQFTTQYYGPHFKYKARDTLAQEVRSNPTAFLEAKTFIKIFKDMILYIGQKEGTTMQDFWLWQLDDQKRVVTTLNARDAEFLYDTANEAIVLTLLNGTGSRRKKESPEDFSGNNLVTLYFQEFPVNLPVKDFFGKAFVTKKSSLQTLWELREQRLLKEKQMLNNDDPSLLQQKTSIEMQIQKNFAMGFSVLSLCLLAIPLGIQVGRKEIFPNIALGLLLALSYYLLMGLVQLFEESPQLYPQYLIWLPNLSFQSLGGYLYYRASKQ